MGKITCDLTPDELGTIIIALDTEIESRGYEASHNLDKEDRACNKAAVKKITKLQERLRSLQP